jgi:hypothetical protein
MEIRGVFGFSGLAGCPAAFVFAFLPTIKRKNPMAAAAQSAPLHQKAAAWVQGAGRRSMDLSLQKAQHFCCGSPHSIPPLPSLHCYFLPPVV